jgi:hypothetical protein
MRARGMRRWSNEYIAEIRARYPIDFVRNFDQIAAEQKVIGYK